MKRRQHTFVPILRDRFVRDGRPLEQWWDVLAEEERLPEDRTMIGAMVVQVLDWSARTGDQKAMMGGFASKLLLVAAVLIGFFATFTLAVGAWPAGDRATGHHGGPLDRRAGPRAVDGRARG